MMNTNQNSSIGFNDKRKMLLSSITFFISFFLLLIFLNFFRNGITEYFIIFWALAITIFSSTIYKILTFKKEKLLITLILFEIFMLVLLLHAVSIMLSDHLLFFNNDSYYLLQGITYITNNLNFITGNAPTYSKWFTFPIITIVLSQILNINLFEASYFIPTLISSVGSIFVYLFGKEMFNSTRVALLGYLLFASYTLYELTHWTGHPEFIAFIFMIMSLYAFLKAKNTSRPTWIIIAILSVFLTIASNYTTAFFLILFFIVMFFSNYFVKIKEKFFDKLNEKYLGKIKEKVRVKTEDDTNKQRKIPVFTFAALGLVIFLSFSIYVNVSAFETSVLIFKDISKKSTITGEIGIGGIDADSLRNYIEGRGQTIYLLFFGLIILYGLLRLGPACPSRRIIYFSLFWLLTGFIMFFSFIILKTSGYEVGPRLLIFFYPVALLLVAYYIFTLKLNRKKIISLILIWFFFVNICVFPFIPSNVFSKSNNSNLDWYYDGSQELNSIDWYKSFGTGAVTGQPGLEAIFGYYIKYSFSSSGYLEVYNQKFDILKEKYSFLYLYGKESSKKEIETDKAAKNTQFLQEVYNNGEWEIYKVS